MQVLVSTDDGRATGSDGTGEEDIVRRVVTYRDWKRRRQDDMTVECGKKKERRDVDRRVGVSKAFTNPTIFFEDFS